MEGDIRQGRLFGGGYAWAQSKRMSRRYPGEEKEIYANKRRNIDYIMRTQKSWEPHSEGMQTGTMLNVALCNGSMETWLTLRDAFPTLPLGDSWELSLVTQESGLKMHLPHQLQNFPMWLLLLHISNFPLEVQARRGIWSRLGHTFMHSCKGGWENEYLALLASMLKVGCIKRAQMPDIQKEW